MTAHVIPSILPTVAARRMLDHPLKRAGEHSCCSCCRFAAKELTIPCISGVARTALASRHRPAQARKAEHDWLIIRRGLSALSSDRVNPNVLLARQLLPGQHMPVTLFFATPPSSRLWMPTMTGRKNTPRTSGRYFQADISHPWRLWTAQNSPPCNECCASTEACSPAP